MAQFTFHFWCIGRPDKEADAAYDAGLTDPKWTYKGGMMFVEFTRDGETLDQVAKQAAAELRQHGVPFAEETLNMRDPTEILGRIADEKLKEIFDSRGIPENEDLREFYARVADDIECGEDVDPGTLEDYEVQEIDISRWLTPNSGKYSPTEEGKVFFKEIVPHCWI